MSNKNVIYWACVVFLMLLTALSVVNAADNTTPDTTICEKTNDYTCNIEAEVSQDKSVNTTQSIVKENKTDNIKTLPAKLDVSLDYKDLSCKRGDIVTFDNNVYVAGDSSMNTLDEGVFTWYVDDELIRSHNLSYNTPSYQYNTSNLVAGVHDVLYEYAGTLLYEDEAATATLTVYDTINVTTEVSDIYSNQNTPNPRITIKTNDSYAYGSIDLYLNDLLVKTFNGVYYDNYQVVLSDDVITPLADGVYTWRLNFTPVNSYVSCNNLTGSLERIKKIDILLEDMTVYYDTVTILPVALEPVIRDGIIIYMVDDDTLGATGLGFNHDLAFEFDSYAYERADHEFKVELRSSRYGVISNTSTITVINRPTVIEGVSASFNSNHDLNVSVRLTSDGVAFTREYDGQLKVYNDSNLIYTSEDLSNLDIGSDINIILPAVYNNKVLKFEYTDDYLYEDTTRNLLVSAEKLPVTISSNNVVGDVGDTIRIPFTFNDTVVDGRLSVSYGGSVDNVIDITTSTNSIIFDTGDYLQGEYELILTYYDSNLYTPSSTVLTLKLYQPTVINADREELNVVLGEGNEYQIEFTTSLDNWDDVIWGSIDIYIDDDIVTTLVVDDDSGNTGSITLDDYLLEDITPGSHTLTAVFATDDPYILGSKTSIMLNVGGIVTIDLPETVNAVMYNDYNMTPVVVQFNGKALDTGYLIYTIGNITHTVDLDSMNTTITQNASYDTGVYTVNMNYHDDTGTYPDATSTFTLIVRTDTPAQFSTVYNNTITTDVYIQLYDNKGQLIDRTVNITLPDGSKIENAEINSTTAYSFTLGYIPSGENTITIEAQENQTYTKLNQTYTFNVIKVKTQITGGFNTNEINDTTATYTLAMNQTNHHDSIANQTVQIINLETNETIGSAITNTSGIAEILTNISRAGDYQLKIIYSGNEFFESAESYVNITVVKRQSQTNMDIINSTLDNTTIKVSVTDTKNGNIIIDVPITITYPDGTQVNTNTGHTGTTIVQLDLPVGENTVIVQFTGNDYYNMSQVTQTINVAQKESLTTATITNSSLRNVTVSVTVTDKLTGDAITSGEVEILDNDGNIIGTGSIDTTGQASITTNIDNKNITELTVKYDGNTNYSESEYTIENLEVTGRLSDITYSISNTTFQNITVNITVRDPITGTPVPNITVRVTYQMVQVTKYRQMLMVTLQLVLIYLLEKIPYMLKQ